MDRKNRELIKTLNGVLKEKDEIIETQKAIIITLSNAITSAAPLMTLINHINLN